VYIKHRLELGPHTAINAKLELHARTGDLAKEGLSAALQRDVQARIEWSGKKLNITNSQDCRLRVGVDLKERAGFVEVRENHLSLKMDSKMQWSVLYDL
jgi:hypothetical protein